MKKDIKRIYDAIQAKRKPYEDLFNYYDGDQPVMYSTQALREVFRNLDARFTLNFCAVVIDAVKERIAFKGFTAKDATANKALTTMIADQDLLNEADEVHESALITGESFVIVWPNLDADGQETGLAEIFYNDPRNVVMFYDPANPKKPALAGKMWCDASMFFHVTIYYPDHLEYYVASKAAENAAGAEINDKSFIPDTTRQGVVATESEVTWPLNPYAPDLPVFHFRIEKRIIKSDIKNVIPPQNAINKLAADMMIDSDFSAWAQRWIISNADVSALTSKPGTVWSIPAGAPGEQPASAGQFEAANLEVFTKAIDKLISYTSSITNTPKHYFDPSSDAPSGEALIAMEAPLNKKTQDRIDKFTPTWQQVAAFALRIQKIIVKPADITPEFDEPETIQPKTSADITKTMVDAGVPLDTALLNAGWSQAEVAEMNKVKDAADAKAKTSLAAALLKANQDMKTQEMPPSNNTQPMPQPMNGKQPQGVIK
jgi:hypothetical protein